MRKRSLTNLLFSLAVLYCRAQSVKPPDSIAARLDRFEQKLPQEKAYLQFDKAYYAAGDTIYFAAYITTGRLHKPSDISAVLHVDLINTANKIGQSIKLLLDSGITHGDFALPDSLPAGNYRIRAYTQWMRNRGDIFFFEKLIPVGSVKPAKKQESGIRLLSALQKPDIQFLPEGGALIADIPNMLAFKAVGPDGLGIAVRGEVLDSAGRVTASLSSAHLGMGEFGFTPGGRKPFRARVTFANGQQNIVELPRAQMSGIALSVDNDSIPVAKVTVRANELYYNQNKGETCTLLLYSGGTITTINCKLDSPVIKFDILKRRLRTGIATLTLFSPTGDPLGERLFFVQNYDQLGLSLKTGKPNYAPRENVSINLNALNRRGDGAQGHFSVSVVNETIVPETDKFPDNILSSLSLTSDLKGYVEQPGYYFSDTSAAIRKDLDLLMLTQGYRGFEWRRILDSTDAAPKYYAERGMDIGGQVYNVVNKPVVGGTVNLIALPGGQVVTGKTNEKGRFDFRNLLFADTAKFVISAVKANGKNSTKITWFGDDYDRPPVHPFSNRSENGLSDATMQNFAEADKAQRTEVASYLNRKSIMLKQVNVKGLKRDDNYYTKSLAGPGGADQVIYPKDILYGGQLSVRLAGLIHGARFNNGWFDNDETRGRMAVIVDGNPGTIDQVPTDGFSTVEVLMPPNSFIYGQLGINGIILITTAKIGSLSNDISPIGILPVSVMGFYKARVFYAPRYDTSNPANKHPDLRSTIYWNPDIQTNAAGSASFDFFNADGAGTYKVVVEGIDKDGNIGRQVLRYVVK